MSKKATLIKELTDLPHVGQKQTLFKLDPPLSENEYVVVSAVPNPFDTGRPETYIFGANEEGKILSWTDLEGSFQGEMNIEKAINNAGYEIED